MPAQDLTLTVTNESDAWIIHVAGELDLSTVSLFETELERPNPGSLVVVELSDCSFIDSSALRSLVRAHGALRAGGGGLVVVAPSQPARRVLEVASLDQVLAVVDSVEAAVTLPA